jgi:deoxycytidylate deaminase
MSAGDQTAAQSEKLLTLDPPPDDELVIGIVSAIGIDLEALTAELQAVLSDFGYRSFDLHLTDAFADLPWPAPLIEKPFDERVWSYMDAGDTLCREWGRADAMALLAILQIAVAREEETGNIELPSARTAYILRSLKRPEEVETLRAVYGRRFFVIGAATEETARLQYLRDRIRQSRIPPFSRTPKYTAEKLAARDESDPGTGREDNKTEAKHGQNVRDTFHRADIFIDLSRDLQGQMQRAFDAVHGNPAGSPGRDEVGMMHAATAALRSAELGRQVGAAICTPDGALIATGVNEVPKAFGGQYWEGDTEDARDVTKKQDTNTVTRREIGLEIGEQLRANKLLKRGVKAQEILDVVEESHFGDVIEYVRAVHAEMAALSDAARRGATVDGATIYVTTFPCHHCARHILAAGIARVVFISPYAKSLALSLHGDALVVGRATQGVRQVPFEPFIGIGPRRYGALFIHNNRKNPDGTLLEYDRMSALARIEDRDPPDLRSDRLPYLQRERRAAGMVSDAEELGGFRMVR